MSVAEVARALSELHCLTKLRLPFCERSTGSKAALAQHVTSLSVLLNLDLGMSKLGDEGLLKLAPAHGRLGSWILPQFDEDCTVMCLLA